MNTPCAHRPSRWPTLALLLAVFVRLPGADAPTEMRYIYTGPESPSDVRYVYHWEILRTALGKTTEKYGPYRMMQSEPMTQLRQAHELSKATGTITVTCLAPEVGYGRNLTCILIPVDRGLVGYRVFLIRRERKDDFAGIATLDDLRRFSFGFGLGWGEVAFLQQSGFTVVTGSTYDGLFEMLVNNRFDALPRGAFEVLDEFEQYRARFPDLFIEESICLSYPHPVYFLFSGSDEGRRLATRAEEGMRMMIDDGTYDRIFDKHQRHKIERLRLKERKLFRVENPTLGPETPFADKRLWFDPQTYSPAKESP